MASSFSRTRRLFRFCFFSTILLFSSLFCTSNAQVKGCPFNSIYSFGDKLDSATSDGQLFLYQLASAYHIPSPDPYRDYKDAFQRKYGVDFGGPGATAMNTEFFKEKGIQLQVNHSMNSQLHSFNTFIEYFCSSRHECVEKLQRALFFVDQFGSNDYKNAFLQGKSLEEVNAFLPHVVQGIKNLISNVLLAGGTKFLVLGSPPMGCLPSYLTFFESDDPAQYDEFNCHRGLNTFSQNHNDRLRQAIEELRLDFPGDQIVYADYYRAFTSLLRHHDILGFRKESLLEACCGATGSGRRYNFDPEKMCGADRNATACSDPAVHINWDGFHLTQHANRRIVEAFTRSGAGAKFLHPQFRLPQFRHCVM